VGQFLRRHANIYLRATNNSDLDAVLVHVQTHATMREHGLFATPDHMDLAHNQHVAVLSRCLHDSALVTLLGQDKKLHGEVQFGRGLVLQLATLLAN